MAAHLSDAVTSMYDLRDKKWNPQKDFQPEIISNEEIVIKKFLQERFQPTFSIIGEKQDDLILN